MSNGSIGTIPHPVSTALIMTARDLSQQVVGCGAAARGRVVPGGLASSHYRFGRHRVLHLPPLPALPEASSNPCLVKTVQRQELKTWLRRKWRRKNV